jgi:hypothetical protein
MGAKQSFPRVQIPAGRTFVVTGANRGMLCHWTLNVVRESVLCYVIVCNKSNHLGRKIYELVWHSSLFSSLLILELTCYMFAIFDCFKS